MPKGHPIQRFLDRPSLELKIANVSGKTIFPLARKGDKVAIFVEFNGYRKQLIFPARPKRKSNLNAGK